MYIHLDVFIHIDVFVFLFMIHIDVIHLDEWWFSIGCCTNYCICIHRSYWCAIYLYPIRVFKYCDMLNVWCLFIQMRDAELLNVWCLFIQIQDTQIDECVIYLFGVPDALECWMCDVYLYWWEMLNCWMCDVYLYRYKIQHKRFIWSVSDQWSSVAYQLQV